MLSKKTETYRTFSSAETKKLGYDIARSFIKSGPSKKNAAVFALQGNLGAGKTTFTQGFVRGLGSKKRVASPTFVLMRRHKLGGAPRGAKKKFANVFHIDAYRLKKPEHLRALELDDILNEPGNIVLIEWPEQARRFLPKTTTWIKFMYGKKEHKRIIVVTRPARK